MKKVLYKEIDGFNIIAGFANMIIDPVATEKKAGIKFIETTEFKQLKKYSDDQNQQLRMMKQAEDSWKLANKQSDKEKMSQYETEYHYRKKKFEEIQDQLLKLKPVINNKRSQIFTENEVYFEPSGYEIHVDDDQYSVLENLFIKNSYVDIDGNVISDNRGIYYYEQGSKWEKTEIKKIGVDPDIEWISENNLTETQKTEIFNQFEAERINGLSQSEKETEAQALKDRTMSESISMRYELEILADPDALIKSQTYYNDRCDEIDDIYGL